MHDPPANAQGGPSHNDPDSAPPPRPPAVPARPSYAASLAQSAHSSHAQPSKPHYTPDAPPPVPPKPAPVPGSSFFGSGPPSTAHASAPAVSHRRSSASNSSTPGASGTTSFRPAGSASTDARRRRSSKPSYSLDLSDDDIQDAELLDDPHSMAPPVVQQRRSSKPQRTYGSSTSPASRPSERLYSSAAAAAPTHKHSEGAQTWDDEWAPSPASPPVASTSRGTGAGAAGDAGVWGGQSWEQVVQLEHAVQHVEHAVAPASPPPPPPRLLEWRAEPADQAFEGWWTVPRVLAKEGENGSKVGMWKESVWDLAPVKSTPAGEGGSGKGLVYRPMGDWVDKGSASAPEGSSNGHSQASAPPSTTTSDVAMQEDGKPLPPVSAAAATDSAPLPAPPSTDSPAPPSPPPKAAPPPAKKGYRTITRAELDAARPHPHLFFCRSTWSWALFAPITPSEAATAHDADEPDLWHVARTVAPTDVSFLSARGQSAPPAPIEPADPSSFSAEHDYAPRPLESLGPLVELEADRSKRAAAISDTDWYPAVIPAKLWLGMLDERGDGPSVGQTPDQARWGAATTVWKAIDNLLFSGESRSLPTAGNHFSKNMPWNATANDIFIAVLGFQLLDGALCMPNVDESTATGRANRERLLRCWLEIGIWLEDFAKRKTDFAAKLPKTRVELKAARPALADALGGDQLPRVPNHEAWTSSSSSRPSHPSNPALDRYADEYDTLGLTPDLADRIVSSVYDQQIAKRVDWQRPPYFEAFVRIAEQRNTDAMQTKLVMEKSRGQLTASEVNAAFHELRLPGPWEGRHCSDEEMYEAFDKRNAEVEHPDRRVALFKAAKAVADFTNNEVLKAVLASMDDPAAAAGDNAAGKSRMDLDAAHRQLDISADFETSMIIPVFEIRMSDAATDTAKAKMREALEVVAEARNDPELLSFVKSGKRDPESGWQAGITADPNVPVGLTNIANTCYLNSLLQYFFTVREVRETILAFHNTPTPHDGPAIRVGGRVVTTAEVKRSKRFVTLLQTLYEQLIHSPISAVTPETELAYLALVPSKEEADAAANASASSPVVEKDKPLSDEPDAIVVEPGKTDAMSAAAASGARSPSYILGKRKNGETDAVSPAASSNTEMQLDSQSATGAAPLSSPSFAGSARMANLSLGESMLGSASGEDAEMADAVTDDERRSAKRGKSEEQKGAEPVSRVSSAAATSSSDTLVQRETQDDSQVDAMPVDVNDADEREPPPLPPRQAARAPSPELPPGLATGNEKQKELERQVSTYMAFGRQNDVTECMDNVMFQVEAALLANSANGQAQEAASLLRRTFFGTMRQQLVFDDPSSVSDPIRTQDEPFSSLLVDVSPSSASTSPALTRDIYDGLDAVFAPSPITLEGHPAQRRVALVAPPPRVLQIQLQRVQYDREKQTVYKSNAHLQFYEEVDVRRYLEVDERDERGQEKRRRTEELRAELDRTRTHLAKLTKDKSSNTATLLRDTASHASHLRSFASSSSPFGLSSSLTDVLYPHLVDETLAEATDLEAEIVALQERVKEVRDELHEVWREGEGSDGTRYELTAVFIHRGTALSGHYYIYQRDHRNPQRWLKYNDSVVSEVDKDEVFRETTGDTNAYFLAYVRKDCTDAIESIKREPV
ncbi:ubiquitin-specific protease UBP2 [Rhodotorula paludigena]|uniref:ubiquitin-specific protease UBP2 n=1 Tax=Rhodotorula paludigena TaxID=86838 RepID=UPI00317652E1